MKKKLFIASALLSFMLTTKVFAQTNSNGLTMTLSPAKIQVGQTLTAEVFLTADKLVNAADLTLNFDPKYLQLSGATGSGNFKTIAPGDGITLDLAKAQTATGTAHIGFAAFDMSLETPTASVSGTNLSIGKIFFQALKAGSTNIAVTSGNAVTIANQTPINILGSLPGLTTEEIIYACQTLDFDKNKTVDIKDIQSIATSWNTNNLSYDLDGNGNVDIKDIQSVASRWLEICL